MAMLTKADLSFRAKLQYITNLLQVTKQKLERAKTKNDTEVTTDSEDFVDLTQLQEKIDLLVATRTTIKREYELLKLKQNELQIDEIVKNVKNFMKEVKKAKLQVTPFNQITAIKTKKKKPKNGSLL